MDGSQWRAKSSTGIGDATTGLMAPLVAYWYYKQRKRARFIAFNWCLFGTLDLLNASVLTNLSNATALLGLPFVLIPANMPVFTLIAQI